MGKKDTPQREDEAIYADDAYVLTTKDTPQDTSTMLINYGTFTKGRNLCIQWSKVRILTHQTIKATAELEQLYQNPAIGTRNKQHP